MPSYFSRSPAAPIGRDSSVGSMVVVPSPQRKTFETEVISVSPKNSSTVPRTRTVWPFANPAASATT